MQRHQACTFFSQTKFICIFPISAIKIYTKLSKSPMNSINFYLNSHSDCISIKNTNEKNINN